MKLKAYEFKKFDGYASETNYSQLLDNLDKCSYIVLVPSEKVIKLEIRWAEIFCKCSNEEWEQFYNLLTNKGIKPRPWTVLDSLLDSLPTVLILIIYVTLLLFILRLYIKFVVSQPLVNTDTGIGIIYKVLFFILNSMLIIFSLNIVIRKKAKNR